MLLKQQAIALYAVGIPATYIWLLYKTRKAIKQERHCSECSSIGPYLSGQCHLAFTVSLAAQPWCMHTRRQPCDSLEAL